MYFNLCSCLKKIRTLIICHCITYSVFVFFRIISYLKYYINFNIFFYLYNFNIFIYLFIFILFFISYFLLHFYYFYIIYVSYNYIVFKIYEQTFDFVLFFSSGCLSNRELINHHFLEIFLQLMHLVPWIWLVWLYIKCKFSFNSHLKICPF